MRTGPTAVLMILAMLAMLAGCGGGSGSSDPPPPNPNPLPGPGPGPIDPGPAIQGFDFALASGDFWEFAWDGHESRFAQGSGGSSSDESGVFRVTLGTPVSIDGKSLFAIQISGNPRWGDSPDFTPRWTHIGLDGNRLLGSVDGVSFEVVFDADTGAWSGGGFFAEWPQDTLIVADDGFIDNAYVSESAISVGRSSSQSQCETIAGVVICGDESYTIVNREYFKPDVGPLGYRYLNSFSFSGGGFSSGGTDEYDIGLVASSRAGDTVNDELELEPNNTPAQAHLLTLPARIRGDNIGEAFYGGFSEVLAAPTVAEVEPNDSQFAAQVITLPAVIQGTVAKGDSAALVTLSGIASPYTTTIEDWYAWQNDPQELRFSLSYSADSGADLDLFVFFGSGEVQALSNKDNVAANDFTEEAILNAVRQTSGTYQVVVDAWDSAGPVDYQLIVQSGAFGGQANVEIMDWYRVELSASASINASITGGASLVLTSAGGDPVLAVSHPATPGANVNLNSGPLAVGSYLIGVSVTDTAYELNVTAQ